MSEEGKGKRKKERKWGWRLEHIVTIEKAASAGLPHSCWDEFRGKAP